MKKEKNKIMTISAGADFINKCSVEAKRKGVSRSKHIRDGVEKTRDMERILSEQKKVQSAAMRARLAGSAAIKIFGQKA